MTPDRLAEIERTVDKMSSMSLYNAVKELLTALASANEEIDVTTSDQDHLQAAFTELESERDALQRRITELEERDRVVMGKVQEYQRRVEALENLRPVIVHLTKWPHSLTDEEEEQGRCLNQTHFGPCGCDHCQQWQAALRGSGEAGGHAQTCNSFEWGVDASGVKFPLECSCQLRGGETG